MEDIKKAAQQMVDALATERDELKVKIHLGGMELKEEWEKMERKWDSVSSHLRSAGHEFNVTAHNVGDDLDFTESILGDAGRSMLDDIREGYRRIREKL